MSTSAIILMVIGCAGLWGGFGVSCAIAFRCEKKKAGRTGESRKQLIIRI